MKIKKIKIRRIREIESLDLECEDRSMIAIIGENGSGKTTTLMSLIYALTGVTILKGNKQEFVRDVGDGPAWVEVEFEHHGRNFTIRRSMDTSSASLKTEGVEKPVKGKTKVDQALLEAGVVPERILQAFLPQGDADSLFKASDSDRVAQVLKIFGLAGIEGLGDPVKEAISDLQPHIDVGLQDRYDDAKTQQGLAQAEVGKAQLIFDEAKENWDLLNDARQMLTAAAEAANRERRVIELESQIDRDGKDRKQIAKEIGEEEAKVERLQGVLAELSERYEGAKEIIYAQQQFDKEADQRRELEQQAEEIDAKIADLGSQIEAAETDLLSKERVEELAQRRDQLGSRIQNLEALYRMGGDEMQLLNEEAGYEQEKAQAEAAVAALPLLSQLTTDQRDFSAQLGVWRHQLQHVQDGKCPTCGRDWLTQTDVVQIEQNIAACQDALSAVEVNLQEHQKLQKVISNADNSLANVKTRIGHLAAEIAQLRHYESVVDEGADVAALRTAAEQERGQIEQTLAGHNQATEVLRSWAHQIELERAKRNGISQQLKTMRGREQRPEELAEAFKLTEAYDQQKNEMQSAANRRDILAIRLKKLDEGLQQAETELKPLKDATPPSFPEHLLEQARKVVEDREEIQARYENASTRLAELRRELKFYSDECDKLSVKLLDQAALRKKIDILQGAKYILHREQFPMFVCRLYADAVSQRWSEELERLGCRFTAWQDSSSLEFFARFESGIERRVYQLSGGERQLAIVAYLFVINRLFAPDLGLIGFDEPTTHVDENFRPIMAEVFRQLAERADEEGFQIFVVDHAPEFLAAIPAAIRLEKAA